MKTKDLILSIIVLLILPACLLGQAETTGRVTGKVVDESGTSVVGATVEIIADQLQLQRTATTGANGEFLFALLPTGSYTVTVMATGLQPQVLTFRLGIGETVPLDVTLAPGDVVSEEITVTGTATAFETTTMGENFNYETEIEQLPVVNRTLESVAQLAPNVSFGPNAGQLSIAGAPAFDTTVLLDGAEISDPYFGSSPTLYLEDAIEEVQVLTSGVSAQYGRFQGGIINAVTKSGTNEFEGTLRTELEKESWNETTPFGEDQADDLNKVYQGTLGGPIVRDHFWFFVGARTIPTESASVTTRGTRESYTREIEEDRWQGKLRWAVNPSHLVDLSYLNFESATANSAGLPAGDDQALGVREDPRESTTLAYQGVLTGNTFIELQATRKNVEIRGGAVDTTRDPFLDLAAFAVYNNSWFDATDPSVRDNETLALSGSHLRDLGRFGSHVFEAGVQYVKSTTGGENRQSASGLNLLALTPDFFAGSVNGEPRFNLRTGGAVRWEALPLSGDQTIENQALYLQDEWTLGSWRFDLGVRYEQYDGEGPQPQFAMDFDDIAPRLGVTYGLTQNWQLQATYGRYISRFNDSVINAVTGVAGGPLIETFYLGPNLLNATGAEVQAALRNDAFWPLITAYQDPTQPSTYLASDAEAPYADEVTLSVRHALPGGFGTIALAYVDREYENLLDDFRGGVCDYGIDFGVPCPSGSTTTIFQNGEAVAEVDSVLWANNPNARREYQALSAVWNVRPPGQSWSVGGNYTYAKTEGNYEGEAANQPASGSPFGNYNRSVDVAAANPFGFADDDIRHRLNLFGLYRFGFERFGDLSLGSVLYYQSGLPWNRTAAVVLADDSAYLGDAGTYTHFFGGRGTERFNDWWSLDLSLRYDVPIFRQFGTFVKLDVLNVLNNDELIQFQTTGRAVRDAGGNLTWLPSGNCTPSDDPSRNCTGFGRIRNDGDYQDPRAYKVTLAFDF